MIHVVLSFNSFKYYGYLKHHHRNYWSFLSQSLKISPSILAKLNPSIFVFSFQQVSSFAWFKTVESQNQNSVSDNMVFGVACAPVFKQKKKTAGMFWLPHRHHHSTRTLSPPWLELVFDVGPRGVVRNGGGEQAALVVVRRSKKSKFSEQKTF